MSQRIAYLQFICSSHVFAISHTEGDLIVAEDGATIQAQKKIKTTGITDISIHLFRLKVLYNQSTFLYCATLSR